MSAAKLLCWAVGHGLSFETRGGLFEIIVPKVPGRFNSPMRIANSIIVDKFPANSRTAKRLEELFEKYQDQLEALNTRSFDEGKTEYNKLYWEVRNGLEGE